MWVPRSWPGSWCPHSDGSAESSECGFHDPGQDRGAHILMAGRVIRMWVPRSWPGSWCLCSDGSAESSECGFHDPGQDRGAHILMARPSHQNVGSTILARIVVPTF